MSLPKTGPFFISLLLPFAVLNVVFAQQSPEAWYNEVLSGQLLIYNGHAYYQVPEPYEGSPIFGDDLWNQGSVIYEDQLFEGIDIFYDTWRDQLVVEHHDMNGYPTYFYLPPEKVSRFRIGKNTFITLSDSIREAGGLKSGYYHVLYEGNVLFLARRKTGLYKEEKQGKFIPTFKNEDAYYLITPDGVHPIRNKRSVRRAFPSVKKELSQYARQQNLVFYEDQREGSLIRLVEYGARLLDEGGEP